jgi:hypothetical protein
MVKKNPETIKKALIEKGVNMPCPESVEIGPEVDPDRIAGAKVVIHTGSRLFGPKTLILPGVELGTEGPVTVQDCFVGRNVRLGSGPLEIDPLSPGALQQYKAAGYAKHQLYREPDRPSPVVPGCSIPSYRFWKNGKSAPCRCA